MKKNKTNAFDWTLIQWARSCDEEKLIDASKIDREIELERDEQGRLVDPESFFSARARRIVESLGISSKRQYERAFSVKLASCCIVVALGALVFPMARVERLLGDEVNLAGPFFFFVVGQAFFLSVSLILSFVLVVQAVWRNLFGKARPKTFGERLVELLSNVVGEVVLFVLRKQLSLASVLQRERPLEAFFSRRRAAQNADVVKISREDSPELKGRALFWDVLFSRPRFLFFWGGTLSQLFWTSCSFCVLIILGMRMQSERYDYRWITSLESRQVVMNVVKGLEPSVSWLGIEPLTKSDVESLFEERDALLPPTSKSRPELSDDKERATAEKESQRARWSYFLLGVVFVWCVLPRAALCAIDYSFYKFSLRDFRPKLNDPYFKKIRENVELRASRTESQYVSDDSESSETSPSSASSSCKTSVYDEIVARSKFPPIPIAERFAPKNLEAETPVESIELSSLKEETLPTKEENVLDSTEDSPTENLASTQDEAPQSASIESIAASDSEVLAPLKEESPSLAEEKREEVSNDSKQEIPAKQEIIDAPKPSLTRRIAASSTFVKRQESQCVVALGYDATLRDEQWRDLLPTSAEIALFGDVADDPSNKKRLRVLLQERGASITLCAFITDVSLPPARHLTRFLRDSLIPDLPNARLVVVLSGGERLRRKFGANSSAVSERLADWKRALESLADETGANITPTFFYDADLDLPEPRAKLRGLLGGRALKSAPQGKETKRKDAAEAICQDCLAIFEARDYSPSEDESRLRVSNLCSRIFDIYRAEVEQASSFGARRLETSGADGSILTRLSSVASKLGGETLVRGGSALSDALATASLEKGLDLRGVEQGLTFACGLSVRAKELCRKLSPKCAIALGSVGLAAPVVVALAPVLGGTLSLSAIATSVGALSSALPSTLVGGAFGGAIGALTPLSLSACKKKLMEKFVGVKGSKENPPSSGSSDDSALESTPYAAEKIADVTTLFCAAAPWFVVLDLQNKSEDEIVDLLPLILEPTEESSFESPEEVRKALDAVVENLQNI